MDLRHNERITQALTKRGIEGATISELVKATGLSRDNVRIALAALEGAGRVHAREVGRAKLYRMKDA